MSPARNPVPPSVDVPCPICGAPITVKLEVEFDTEHGRSTKAGFTPECHPILDKAQQDQVIEAALRRIPMYGDPA